MKRFYFLVVSVTLAITACTESGLVETPGLYANAIVFDTYIGKTPVTKAQSWEISQLRSGDNGSGAGVHIYAFMCDNEASLPNEADFSSTYLDGKLLDEASSSNAAQWKYYEEDNSGNWLPTDAYWPLDKKLAFAGYSLNAGVNTSEGDITEFDFTVNSDVSLQRDLLVTPLKLISGEKNADTQVSLTFYHVLSRVGFKVLATDNSSAFINIKSVKLCGTFPTKGRVDLKSTVPVIVPYTEGTDASYQNQYILPVGTTTKFQIASSECYVGTETNPGPGAKPIYDNSALQNLALIENPTTQQTDAANQANQAALNDRFMMLMPGTYANAYIEVEYILSGESESHYAKISLDDKADDSLITWTFTKGKAYEFILKISTASIEFEAVVGDVWGTATEYPQV